MSAGASFDLAGKNGVKKYTPMLYRVLCLLGSGCESAG